MVSGPDQSGQVAGVEAVVFGMLVFVVGTLVVANAWGVIDAKSAASAAAREATRAFVEADDEEAASELAHRAAREAIRGHGRDPDRMGNLVREGRLERCSRVTITVTYPVPVVAIPVLGRLGGVFTVSAAHSEVVDPFRSGLPGVTHCPGPVG